MKKSDRTTYNMVIVGVMAAVCFATTFFLKVVIPTPAGPTMIKIGNIFCLLAGLLFGGIRGGLAAGIGSFIFDLTNPLFVASSPFTLVFFFLMGFICGTVSHIGSRNGKNTAFNLFGAIAGSVAYFILHIGKSIIALVLEGSAFWPAVAANSARMITSGINAAISVAAAVLIAPALRKALERLGVYSKM